MFGNTYHKKTRNANLSYCPSVIKKTVVVAAE